MEVKLIQNLSEIDAEPWNNLTGYRYPFLRHEFLLALEQTGAVSAQTGWLPHHLIFQDENQLLALMPLYLKTHSRGEYVFDYQWAQVYQQTGKNYYPKWLTAIPFTPCQGPRLVVKQGVDEAQLARLVFDVIRTTAEENAISSWHYLFPEPAQIAIWRDLGMLVREGVQFQWHNKNYRDFDDFLQSFNAAKRKMIKRERRKVQEQGIVMQRLNGQRLSEAQWSEFYDFYAMTYLKNGHSPYLTLAFFLELAQTMGDQLLIIFAVKDGKNVGAALSIIGEDTLYGRYWGCHEEYNALHFEACYYQGLEYCIEHGLARFDSGAQGEHKIARGFEPVTTYSAHWLSDPGFANAVEHFLARERRSMALYKADAAGNLPFKKLDGSEK
ncbi:MAG: GNAT family N-acetyltransferase [Methylobacter sp.]|nr:MAG: GNAT family N-acetyltransferase [Methylobacter sp.]